MHVEAGMPPQPRLHLGMVVGSIVVGDQVHSQTFGCLGIDPTQELEPFLVEWPITQPVTTSRTVNKVVVP